MSLSRNEGTTLAPQESTVTPIRESRDRNRDKTRANLAMEQLDHRQLLSVTFTGNVATDFSAANPDVVTIRPNVNDPRFSVPVIEEPIRDLVRVSGFHLSAIRLIYDPQLDTLQLGLEQPDNQKTSRPVIAGDADNNLNGGTVATEVTDVVDDPDNYIDFPSIGGTETMLSFLNFDPQNNQQSGPNIVAGIDAVRNDPSGLKSYQVARFNVNANPDIPGLGPISPFGEFLADNTGSSLLGVNSESPGFEFTINNFSELYQEETGRPLTFPVTIEVGAFAGSSNDGGTSEAFIPATQVTLPRPTTPPGPSRPQSPQVLINPHSQQHVNTAVNAKIRVYIFGTSGFRVSEIVPSSVRLGGAAPVFDQTRSVNSDQFPDRVFVFNSKDVELPRGGQDAVVSGQLTDGSRFESAARVYNQPGFFTAPSNDNAPVPIKPLNRGARTTTPPTRRQQQVAPPARQTPVVIANRQPAQRVDLPNPSRNRPRVSVGTQTVGSKPKAEIATIGQVPMIIGGVDRPAGL